MRDAIVQRQCKAGLGQRCSRGHDRIKGFPAQRLPIAFALEQRAALLRERYAWSVTVDVIILGSEVWCRVLGEGGWQKQQSEQSAIEARQHSIRLCHTDTGPAHPASIG